MCRRSGNRHLYLTRSLFSSYSTINPRLRVISLLSSPGRDPSLSKSPSGRAKALNLRISYRYKTRSDQWPERYALVFRSSGHGARALETVGGITDGEQMTSRLASLHSLTLEAYGTVISLPLIYLPFELTLDIHSPPPSRPRTPRQLPSLQTSDVWRLACIVIEMVIGVKPIPPFFDTWSVHAGTTIVSGLVSQGDVEAGVRMLRRGTAALCAPLTRVAPRARYENGKH
ncbi:hypothetical protein BJ875DRAFT_87691 [Amylocarpus encephaloides]|uniref:Protein kinase domain-containing protein n=1 Tax=Amylocarpus encephaloides TaxID=45428 RepID=A0A9P7YRL8_9HELO|nr:hypothetical protein BJ875DRAFT_87691 [Amylocarpus encephaloides]